MTVSNTNFILPLPSTFSGPPAPPAAVSAPPLELYEEQRIQSLVRKSVLLNIDRSAEKVAPGSASALSSASAAANPVPAAGTAPKKPPVDGQTAAACHAYRNSMNFVADGNRTLVIRQLNSTDSTSSYYQK